MKKPYTQEELENLKIKYPKVVRELVVYPADAVFDKDGKSDDIPSYFLIKKPSKTFVELLGSKEYQGEENQDKANKAMIANCVLAGDFEDLENDASIFLGVVSELARLIQSSKVELKKV